MNSIDLETAAFLLSMLCLIYSLSVKRKQYKLSVKTKNILLDNHIVFLVMLLSIIVSAAASVSGSVLQKYASESTIYFQYLFHAIYYFAHNILSICFALYIMDINGSSAGRKPLFFLCFSMPFLLCELMVLTNRFTGFTFYIDDQLIYHRGSLITFVYISGILYFVLGFVFFFRHKRAISKTDRNTIGFLMSLSVVGVAIQAVDSSIAVELFFESLTTVGLMLMIEERSGHVDPTTGALNRVALTEDCRRLLGNGQSFRIVLVNLSNIDMFAKLFNGREMDNLLMQVSSWLTSISSDESMYNYRSNDFALLYNTTDDHEITEVTDIVLKRFEHDWKSGEATLRLEASVSVIRMPEDVSNLDELMEILTSGYRKTSAGSHLVTHDELSAHQRSRKIEQSLRDAVENNLLRVWYQPIWSVDEQRTVSAEALLRIDSEELRGISPAVYIPIAEQCGVIREIGLFVFEDVCRFLKCINDQDLGISYIELNLSLYQFLYDDLAERFEEIRKRYGITPDMLNLEITETASIADSPIVEKTLKKLRTLGYTFSLDDFGTGYSTLVQFIRISYKNVKIDKSLLWESDKSEMSARLLDSLTHLIRSLGCNVVQEGVETKEQLSRTAGSGGNLIQGYYFSKPIPENDFIAYVKKEVSQRKG